MRSQSVSKHQRGVALLEALIAVLVFSIGILALIGLQGFAVSSTAAAKYRADAAYLAGRIINRIWIDQTNFASYKHNDNDGDPATDDVCNANGGSTTSAFAPVSAWLAEVDGSLPGASGRQRIVVSTGNDPVNASQPLNQVTVVVCWKSARETDYHSYTATARIGG